MRKDATLVVRLPADVKDALRRAAEEDERTVSVLVERVLRGWLREHRYIAPERRARRGSR